jgi:hypothetical protein
MRFAGWVLAAAMVGGATRPVTAQTGPLAPTGGPPARESAQPPDPAASNSLPPEPTHSTAPAERIPNVLGAPVRAAPVGRGEQTEQPPHNGNVRVAGVDRGDVPGSSEPGLRSAPGHPGEVTRRAAGLGAPEAAGSPIPARTVESSSRAAASSDTTDAVNELLAKRSGARAGERKTVDRGGGEHSAGKFGDQIGETLGNVFGNVGDSWFRSDHVFDGFISPVTNPFLFEDPRSLTEVRPIFLYQKVPSDQPQFKGGGTWFFGTQARVAVTDRLSFVMNKLGGTSINPGSGSIYDDQLGFSELWLGPKYTIVRGEETGSLLAAGLQFQIPIGGRDVFQNTGDLSLVPYLTYGQNFGRDFRLGSFNAMVGTGYAASINNKRSDYYYLSAHLDMDVFNNHKFYPLTELNWVIYTTDGKTFPGGVEGRDLFNLGGQASGSGLLTWAVGARYKFSESAQIGAAFEIPVAGPRDMFRYRFTLDFILRY